MTLMPPPPPLPWPLPAAPSSSAAAGSSYYDPKPALPAGTNAVEVRLKMLQDTVDGMRQEINGLSTKMDVVIGLMDTLKKAVHLTQSVQPASFQ
jgi:hypothetical protein